MKLSGLASLKIFARSKILIALKSSAVLLAVLCAGTLLAGCGQADSAHSLKKALDEAARQYLNAGQKSYESQEQAVFLSDSEEEETARILSKASIDKESGIARYEQKVESEEQDTVVFYTEDGYYYFQAEPESAAWYRMPSKDIGIGYEDVKRLPDALYEDDANVKYEEINYRKATAKDGEKENQKIQKIEVEGTYLYKEENVKFTDIWWIEKEAGSLVKCESRREFDSGQESNTVITIQIGKDCEKIQDFPEDYQEITKEQLENGEFGL